MAMKDFTSKATKDGRWWVVQCDQEPGAISQVARLDQAAEAQREAISMVTDIDESEIAVEVFAVLDETFEMAVQLALAKRQEAEAMQREASERLTEVAKVLVEEGMSLRDIGQVLRISHQRVGQLVNPPAIGRTIAEAGEAAHRAIDRTSGKGTYRTKREAERAASQMLKGRSKGSKSAVIRTKRNPKSAAAAALSQVPTRKK